MHCSAIHTPHLDRILARQRRLLVTDLLLWSLITVGLLVVALAA